MRPLLRAVVWALPLALLLWLIVIGGFLAALEVLT